VRSEFNDAPMCYIFAVMEEDRIKYIGYSFGQQLGQEKNLLLNENYTVVEPQPDPAVVRCEISHTLELLESFPKSDESALKVKFKKGLID